MPVFLSGCEKQEMKPVDDFYRFDKLKKLTLKKPAKTNYVLGYDTETIGLSVTAYESGGLIVKTPQAAVSLYSNSTKLEGESFKPTRAGVYKVYGKLAGTTSDTLTINVWDPASLTLKISTLNDTDDVFYADGADTVGFNVKVWAGGKILPIQFNYSLTANDNLFSKRFSTKTPGSYKFQASAFGLESNEITINAVVPLTYDVVRLPVIFHEINTADLTATYIRQLTDGMTKAYRNQFNMTGGPKDPNSKDLYVEFYPAVTDLNGQKLPIPGLDREVSDKTTFTGEEAFQEAFHWFWDPNYYINVWVIPNITGDYQNSSWAYLPYVTQPMDGLSDISKGIAPFLPYGIFLNKIMTGTNTNGNRTEEVLAHEAGHILGLYHTFDGNGSDHNVCSSIDPDFCSDTPYYDRKLYAESLDDLSGSEEFSRVSCQGSSYTATNFMDYYFCYNNSFTNEQLKRVRHTINYGVWLPTPFNGFKSARVGHISKVKKPANLKYIKPIICR